MTSEQITTSINIINLIVVVIEMYLNISGKEYKHKKWILLICTAILGIGIITSGVYVNKYMKPDEVAGLSRNEMIAKAEGYYKMEDYIKAAGIYQEDVLDVDAVAINNLAYLYENGLGVAKDLNVAAELYKKAANLGNETAQANWVYFTIRHPKNYGQIIDALEYGCDIGDKDSERIVLWLNGTEELITGWQEQDVNRACDEFFQKEYGEQKEAINQFLYEITVPMDYYVGIEGSIFASIKPGVSYKTFITGDYAVKKTVDGKKSYAPIVATVEYFGYVEQIFLLSNGCDTEFIFDQSYEAK